MRMWIPYVHIFRETILKKLKARPQSLEFEFDNELDEEIDNIFRNLDPDLFRVFGFVDDVEKETTTTGEEPRRREGYTHDLQRAFYSGYFKAHGLKAQVVWLPNGMVGSVFVTSIAHNDRGVQNMSGLGDYLLRLFRESPAEFEIGVYVCCQPSTVMGFLPFCLVLSRDTPVAT
jgi:hypothetical protein